MRKLNKKVIIAILSIVVVAGMLIAYNINAYATEPQNVDIESLLTREIDGFHVVDKQMIDLACHGNVYQRWDGYKWVTVKRDITKYYDEYITAQSNGLDDQTPQNGSNEYNWKKKTVPSVEEGVAWPEDKNYLAYEADYWAFMVLYAPDGATGTGTVIVKYVDEATDSDIIPPDTYENIYVGNHVYTAEDLTGYGYALNDNKYKSLSVQAGQTYIITFNYTKNADTTKPNLKPTDITLYDSSGAAQTTILEGTNYTVKVKVENASNIAAGESTTILTAGGVSLGSVGTPSLNASGSIILSFNFTATNSSSIVFIATADSTNAVDESNENDNVLNRTLGATSFVGPYITVSAKDTVILGDYVNIGATGGTKDKYATRLDGQVHISPKGASDSTIDHWEVFDANPDGHEMTWSKSTYFTKTGTYNIAGYIEDNNGNYAVDSKTITVVNPTPKVNIQIDGAMKENRKLVLDLSTSNGGSDMASIDWTSATWSVAPLSSNTSTTDIKIQTHTEGSVDGTVLYNTTTGVNSSLNGYKILDMLFKEAGSYQLTCTLTNNYGITGTSTSTITIKEDLAPTAGFSVPSQLLRDPNDLSSSGFAQATLTATDTQSGDTGCYSKDGDNIDAIAWFISFDSNDNNTFEDDKWYWYNPDAKKLEHIGVYEDARNFDISSKPITANHSFSYKVTHVGNYNIGVICREKYGQEYIPQFITDADKKTSKDFDS